MAEQCGTNPAVINGYGYTVAPSGWGECGEFGTSKYRWGEPLSLQVRKDIQYLLSKPGWYGGPHDGIWGPASIRAIQQVLQFSGYYTGPVDGIPGSATVLAVGEFACRFPNSKANYYEWNARPTLDNVATSPSRGAGTQFWNAVRARLIEAWG